MDWSLSLFLNEMELRSQTWCVVECDADGGFSSPPDDRFRFYAMLEGTARIAGVLDETICLEEGEVAIVVGGGAHAVRARPESRAAILDFMRHGSYGDVPPKLVLGKGGPVVSRILCGRLKVIWPGDIAPASLPPVLRFKPGESVIGVKDLAHSADGIGAAGLLTRMSAVMVAEALRRHAAQSHSDLFSGHEDSVSRALRWIDAHPAEHWSVSSLAQKIGMGRSNFATRFAAVTGRTPMEMLAERRMQLAEELLQQQGQLKISEISVRVGYRSQAAFIRRFVRHFGTTPGAMRDRLHGADLAS